MHDREWWLDIVGKSPKFGGVLARAHHVKKLRRCKAGQWLKVHHATQGLWEKPVVLIKMHGEDWDEWDISGGPIIWAMVKDNNGDAYNVNGWNVEIVGRRNPTRKARSKAKASAR